MIGKRLRRRSKRLSTSNVDNKPLLSISDSETTSDKCSKLSEDLKSLSTSNVQTKPSVSISDSETTSVMWSNLPQDVLCFIADRIFEENDFTMFRSVCQAWRSAVPRSHWKRVPWLLAKRYETPRVVLKGLSSFENTSLDSLYHTELHWRYWGSFTGWILGQHYSDYKLKLINPLTKAVIDLPQLNCLIKKGLVYRTRRADCPYPSIQVMAISHMFSGVAILDHGYKEWKVLEDIRIHRYYETTMFNQAAKSEIVDAIWYKEQVTAIRADGSIVFFDEARVVVSLPPPIHVKLRFHDVLYMVESSGELLIVVDYDQAGYKVYKLNIDTGEWIHVKALGVHSLFIGQSYSTSRWMSDNEKGNTWKSGCIYDLTDHVSKLGNLYGDNVAKKRSELHRLGHVSDLNRCYDFIWYMPAVGSQ
ncbi:hypothetical protein DCAR_0311169 [Daucus carota subsp. sativus]|uniref:KIB1-4 beta-propeller domain-containing protein n=1 Tax=Daucus carota subsp. sativus TaxID=79200 RepID=A0A166AEU2_DAUCS|nr:hypothetical protein DCAR_0311169 [Daucus carota subsp. sativus]